MSIFAIGDLHLSFGTNKPMDIFRGWDNHADRLKEHWLYNITDSDTVVLAGDFSWAMTLAATKEDFKYLSELPGKKIMLKGNHDYWWETVSKSNKFLEENGFFDISFLNNNSYIIDDIALCGTRGWINDNKNKHNQKIILREAGRLRLSLESVKDFSGEIVVFLHYPPIFRNDKCEEILTVLTEFNIKRCYYGHIHGANISSAFRGEYDGIQFDLISADALKFCPVKIH